jgi:hypothetical protein
MRRGREGEDVCSHRVVTEDVDVEVGSIARASVGDESARMVRCTFACPSIAGVRKAMVRGMSSMSATVVSTRRRLKAYTRGLTEEGEHDQTRTMRSPDDVPSDYSCWPPRPEPHRSSLYHA